MGRCVAFQCKEIGSHKFPSNPTLRRKCGKSFEKSKLQGVIILGYADKNFKDTDFETISKETGFPLQRKFLKKSAIPTIFSWNTSSDPGSSLRAECLKRRYRY